MTEAKRVERRLPPGTLVGPMRLPISYRKDGLSAESWRRIASLESVPRRRLVQQELTL